MTDQHSITVPLPRVPGLIVGLALGLIIVGAFLAIDKTVAHWYVPDQIILAEELNEHLDDYSALRSDLRDLQSDVRAVELSVDTLDTPTGAAIYDTNFQRDAAIARLGFAVTINSLANNLGGFQTNTSPRGRACQGWLLTGEGSLSDCGFTPTN